MFDFLRNLTKSAGEKQQEALNAYLDDALSPKERRQFEQLLAQDSGLRLELEQRRLLKEQLRQLPRRPVPRHFTLDPTVYGRPQRQPLFQLYPAMRVATALTAFFFILAVAADLFLGQGAPVFGGAAPQDVAMVAEEVAGAPTGLPVEVTRVVTETEMEVIIEEVEVAGEEPVEEMTAEEEPAMEAVEEGIMAEAPEEGAVAADEAAPAAEAPAPETADIETDTEAAAAVQEPARAATAAPTPLPAPTLTEPAAVAATKSTVPRPSAETVAGERAVTAVPTSQPQGANETDDTAATAVTTTAPPPDEPVNGLRLLQIGLGVALIILITAVFYTRRQL